MPSSSRVHRLSVLVVVLALGWFGCTVDDPQVSEIGAVSLLTVDPAIVPQSVILAPPGTITSNRLQTMLWDITKAELTLPGVADPYDLLFGNGAPDWMWPDSQFRAAISATKVTN